MILSDAIRECQLYNRMVTRDRSKSWLLAKRAGVKDHRSHPLYLEHLARRNTLGKRVIARLKEAGYRLSWRYSRIHGIRKGYEGDMKLVPHIGDRSIRDYPDDEG